MGFNLRVKTKAKPVEKSLEKEEEDLEPLSPGSEVYFNHGGEQQICILAVFESEIPIDATAVYSFLKDDLCPISPRFSSIMIEDKKGKKMWKKVDVNIQDHVKIPIFPEGLSPECYSQYYYDDYISKISKEQVPLDRPLWQCHIFKYPISHECRAVIILKFHHAIADGVSLMGGLFSCFRKAANPSLPLKFPLSATRDKKKPSGHCGSSSMKIFSMVPKFISSVLYFFYDVEQGLRKTYVEDDQTPVRSGNNPSSTRISTVTLSLEDVKRIKTRLGVTVNDVVLGAIFLGTQLYMQEMKPESRKLRSTALLPTNARSTKGYAHTTEMHNGNTKVPWGNKISVCQLRVPFSKQNALANPLDFVNKPHKLFKRMRTSLGQHLLAWLIVNVSPKVAARLFYAVVKNSSLLISSMIGPTEQMSLGNHPINTFYFTLVGLKMSLVVSIMSYMQKLQIGFGVEEDFIDRERLIKCVENAFKMLLKSAMATPE